GGVEVERHGGAGLEDDAAGGLGEVEGERLAGRDGRAGLGEIPGGDDRAGGEDDAVDAGGLDDAVAAEDRAGGDRDRGGARAGAVGVGDLRGGGLVNGGAVVGVGAGQTHAAEAVIRGVNREAAGADGAIGDVAIDVEVGRRGGGAELEPSGIGVGAAGL